MARGVLRRGAADHAALIRRTRSWPSIGGTCVTFRHDVKYDLSRKHYITAKLIPKSWRSPLGHGRACPGHLGNCPNVPSREIAGTSPAMTSRTYRETGTDVSTLFPRSWRGSCRLLRLFGVLCFSKLSREYYITVFTISPLVMNT